MSLGADKALCLKLGYVVATDGNADQIVLICQCLAKVYQCSPDFRMKSFRHLGTTDLVPLLMELWNQYVNHVEPYQSQAEEEEVLRSVVQLLRVFAKLEEHVKSAMIRFEQGSLLASFMDYIITHLEQKQNRRRRRQQQQQQRQQQQSSASSSPSSSLHREDNGISQLIMGLFGILKDLTFRSNASDKEFLICMHGGITKRVIFLCCSMIESSSDQFAEVFTAILWNLLLEPAICVDLLEYHGQSTLVIPEALCHMLSCRSSTTIHEAKRRSSSMIKARRNAISALGNLISNPKSQFILFQPQLQAGLRLIPVLMQLVEGDPDSILRRRAMRTLRCLASSSSPSNASAGAKQQSSSSCRSILLNQGIVSFLIDVIARSVSIDGEGNQNDDDDNDRDTQIQACQSIGSLVDGFDKDDWPRLEIALLQRIEATTDPKLTLAACTCLSMCIGTSPWKRGPQSFPDLFWKRIEMAVASTSSPSTSSSSSSSLLSQQEESHACIARLLLEIARQEQTSTARGPTTTNHPLRPSVLVCVSVINALTNLLSELGPTFESSRNDALEVVVLLVQSEVNKRPLAEHEGLLTALVNVCLLQSGRKKDLAKRVILDLVPEL